MKKFVVLIAALAAVALIPASALATVSTYSYPTNHCDNLADPSYASHFSSNGAGASDYGVAVGGSYDSCSGTTGPAVFSPVVFGGWLDLTSVGGPCEGCAHGRDPNNSTGGFTIGVGATPGGSNGTAIGIAGP